LWLGAALLLEDDVRLGDGLAFWEAGSDDAAPPGLGVEDAAVLTVRAALTKKTAPQPPHPTMKTTEQITATMAAVEMGFRGGLATGPLAVLMRFP
jgi:NaMN:DMB phosphoribosyltransferase